MAERQGPRKGERTRQRILAVALDLFAEQGFTGTSVRDIAARADMTHAGLLHHFPTKRELLARVLEYRERQEVDLIAEEAQSNRAALFTWALDIVRLNEANPDRMSLYVKLLAESTDPEHPAHEYFRNRYRRFVEMFEPAFAEKFAEQRNPPQLTAGQASHQFLAMLDGLQLQALADLPHVDMLGNARLFLAELGVDLL